ncbi:N-acetylmuramic acid 6-phosphate etherase [Salinibacterium sp. M195]|uniref:N-acetylmuramic acid 6-phosphate etherase n=1 Tax=Salinibacterium sp. M195 TaxID=2583374 RepID=UPI001C62F80D|nr:N-acetylmuramic acid 6-phosphate etherase [Salinibacterium sp. M195]
MSMLNDLDGLATEAVDPRYTNLDLMSVAELATAMNEADSSVPGAVQAQLPAIVPAIEAASERMAAGGRLVYVGAGTPGRIGVVDASECPPTFNTPPELVFAIMAGGSDAIVTPKEGAEDDGPAGAAAIDAAGIGPLDTVIGIASSGRTPFVISAIEHARSRGALTVGLSCNVGTALSAAAEFAIEVAVGPEVLTGSTRLKAGTAQKLVLNMFSTIVMVRQGKTYGSLMVDLKPTNHKLRARAVRMVAEIANASRDDAESTLETTSYDVKASILMLALGCTMDEARNRLAQTSGRLRLALEGA